VVGSGGIGNLVLCPLDVDITLAKVCEVPEGCHGKINRGWILTGGTGIRDSDLNSAPITSICDGYLLATIRRLNPSVAIGTRIQSSNEVIVAVYCAAGAGNTVCPPVWTPLPPPEETAADDPLFLGGAC
jgi:hypothetical protein